MIFKNPIKILLVLALLSAGEAMPFLVGFKIKDIPKYYIYYLPNRIPVLKELYSNYLAKSISRKKFAWGVTLEAMNVYFYIDIHKQAGECMYDHFKDRAQP